MSRVDSFLETATRLGARLCRDALWDGERCNWLGAATEFHEGRWQVVHRSGGPALYEGTSGIALFLARLHQLTSEKPFRTIAEAALRQALSRVEQVDPRQRGSFHCGWLGIAWCLVQLGKTFGEERFLEQARDLLERLIREGLELQGVDVIAGSAGAIAPLLVLQRFPNAGKLLEFAVANGERLLETACRAAEGWSWDVGIPSLQPLTGLAHGAGGIGLALLELYAATQETRFRRAAEEAFRYEQHWFDSDKENWPDFRIHGPQQAEPGFGVAWCHGAAGIGLTRLRAFQLVREPAYRNQAEAAIRTTRRWLREAKQNRWVSFSLCHGIGGNVELLLLASQVFGLKELQEEGEHWGEWGAESYEEQGYSWPCGVPGGEETSGLMLGLAGIGYFYLRLFDPVAVSSVLLCIPEAIAEVGVEPTSNGL